MRAIWNGFISFGLVTIPVSVGLAQQRSDVSFRTLSRATGQPVKQKRWDPDRDVEVSPDDTVKGWEVSKGRYLPVEDSELERFAARQEKTVQILQFVELSEVDPVFFERAYWLEPQERAERPYALLTRAMERTGRAAMGRFVLSTKEHLVLLRPVDGMLALQTLYYPEDVRLRDKKEIVDRARRASRCPTTSSRWPSSSSRASPSRSTRRPTPTRPGPRCWSSSRRRPTARRWPSRRRRPRRRRSST